MSSSWLRVSTSSETMVISFSSVSTLTRIDWLATLLSASRRRPSALGAGVAGILRRAALAPARGPDCRARRFAESALQLVERDFAGRAAVPASAARAGADGALGALGAALRHLLELAIRSSSAPSGSRCCCFERVQNFLDAVDGRTGSA